MTSRGERTRERLLAAAELLYGERGVDAVSLREIRLAAGQRNSSALQFHFGDRNGLLLALSQRHLPRLAAIQQTLRDEVEGDGRLGDISALVELLVRPTAEYVRLGPSERAWIKISAERAAHPGTDMEAVADHASPITLEAATAIYAHLAETMPNELAVDRLVSVSLASLHLSADRARLEDAAGEGTAALPAQPFDAWITNLVDMAVGAMLAPSRASAHR